MNDSMNIDPMNRTPGSAGVPPAALQPTELAGGDASAPRYPGCVCTGPLPTAGLSRRHFLNRFGMGLGGIALAHLLTPARAMAEAQAQQGHPGLLTSPHFPAKAKRVIYLFMAGHPSQLATFYYHPLPNQHNPHHLPQP